VNKEVKGTSLAVLTAIISGFAIVANRFFVIKIDPVVFTAVRALFIGIVFLLISSYKKQISKKTSWKSLFIIGIFGGGVAFLLFFSGLKMTTSGHAAFLHKTLPIYATLFAFLFLKEKVTKNQVLWLLSMLVGAFFIFASSMSSVVEMGDLLVVAATILWAAENVFAKHVMKKEHNFVVSFGRMFFGSIFLFGLLLILGKVSVLLVLTPVEWFYIAASTIILFGYVFCWYWSVRLINVSKASALLLLAPVISLVLGVYLLKETVTQLQLIGSALILLGAWRIGRIKSEFLTE